MDVTWALLFFPNLTSHCQKGHDRWFWCIEMARQTVKAIVQMFKASNLMFNSILEKGPLLMDRSLTVYNTGRSKSNVIYVHLWHLRGMINTSGAKYLYILSLNQLFQPKRSIYWNHEKVENIVNIHIMCWLWQNFQPCHLLTIFCI